jgi:predicted RNA-binding protein associated with RNAse of E/G family
MTPMTVSSHLLPAARRGDSADVVDVHPPKLETFDVPGMTNVDPKGNVRRVDEYRVEPFGLYLAREVPGHPTLSYRESWLLPELGIQVTDWYFRPGQERDQDFYLDIGLIRPGERTWQLVDLYLDVVLRTGRGLDVLDTDELLGATGAGYIDARTAQAAIETTHHTVEQLAAHDYDLGSWLAGVGIELTWRRR